MERCTKLQYFLKSVCLRASCLSRHAAKYQLHSDTKQPNVNPSSSYIHQVWIHFELSSNTHASVGHSERQGAQRKHLKGRLCKKWRKKDGSCWIYSIRAQMQAVKGKKNTHKNRGLAATLASCQASCSSSGSIKRFTSYYGFVTSSIQTDVFVGRSNSLSKTLLLHLSCMLLERAAPDNFCNFPKPTV